MVFTKIVFWEKPILSIIQKFKFLYFICNNINLLYKLSCIWDKKKKKTALFGQSNLYSYVFVTVG